MDYIIVFGSIATAFNIVIIYYKFTHSKLQSAIVDLIVLILLSILFAGTVSGLSISMISGLVFSIYLLITDFTKPKPVKPKTDYDRLLDMIQKM